MARFVPDDLPASHDSVVNAASDRDAARGLPKRHLAWGLLGFLLGAVFWHVVGFWDFLGGVVYKRQQEATVFERVLTLGQRLADEDIPLAEQERLAHLTAQNCTTLVFDRLSGATTSRPCVVIIRNVPDDVAAATSSAGPLQTAARLDTSPAKR